MKRIVSFIIGFISLSVYSQPFFEFNNRHLPQSHLWNPAFMPQYKASISVGQTYLGATMVGTNLNNILGSNETPLQTVNRIIQDREKQLGMDLHHQTDLFFFGFRSKKSYFALNTTLINEAAVRVPKDLFGLAFLGNGAYIGNDAELDFSDNRFRSYLKNTFSYGRYVTNELTLGANMSLLNGIADFGLNKALIGIGTDTGTNSIYSLNLRGALEGRASLLGADVNRMLNDSNYDVNESINNQLNQLSLGTNRGYAFGLGATYRMNQYWRFSLSVQNLGSITWNLGAQEVSMKETSIQWNGLDSFSENATEQLVDSLITRFEITNRTISSYTTMLKPRYILGAEFFLMPRTQLQAVVGHGFGINGDKTFISANLHQEIGELIDLRVGYSLFDFSAPAHRLGLGLSLNLGPIQFFASVNDVLSIVYYGNARTASGMFGLNINIGTRKDRDYDDVKDSRDSCRKTFGVISNNGCPYGFLGESMNSEEEATEDSNDPEPPMENINQAQKEVPQVQKTAPSTLKTPVPPSNPVNNNLSNAQINTDSAPRKVGSEEKTEQDTTIAKAPLKITESSKLKQEPKTTEIPNKDSVKVKKKEKSKNLDDLMNR